MRMEENNESTNSKFFPVHILEIIFSKLPIVHLPFCRLVCKSWNDAVLDSASSSTLITPNPSIIVWTRTDGDYWLQPRIHCIDFEGNNNFVASLDSNFSWWSTKIVNSCNGLLCFSKRVGAFKTYVGVLNLMTNEWLQLLDNCGKFCHYGLGFSLETKRYKIARAIPSSGIVEIFTFGGNGNGNNQWSSVDYDDESTSLAMICSDGVYFDGALYWVVKDRTREIDVIARLDVEQEKLGLISLPQQASYYSNLGIGVFSGNFYASFSTTPWYVFEVWIMGKDCSWIKNFIVDYEPRNWNLPPPWREWKEHRIQLIKVCQDGKILFIVDGFNLFTYNSDTQMVRLLNNNKNERRKASWIYQIESFSFDSLQKILFGDG